MKYTKFKKFLTTLLIQKYEDVVNLQDTINSDNFTYEDTVKLRIAKTELDLIKYIIKFKV